MGNFKLTAETQKASLYSPHDVSSMVRRHVLNDKMLLLTVWAESGADYSQCGRSQALITHGAGGVGLLLLSAWAESGSDYSQCGRSQALITHSVGGVRL